MQLWGVIGAWVAGMGTVFAASVALHLARRSEKVRLKAHVGLRSLITPGISTEECVQFYVTNLGVKPVTIILIGWRIGRWKQKAHAVQIVSSHSPHNYPKKLKHGETATFLLSLTESPMWLSQFATDFVKDAPLTTLRAQFHTSVGSTHEVLPEQGLLDKLKSIART